MNEKDKAALEAVIAQLTEGFKVELRAAVQPLVEEIDELQQRSHNFAARVNAHNKILRGEITSLRARLEALEPKPKAPVAPRLSDADWKAAHAALCAESRTSQTFFAPGIVKAKAEAMKAKPEPVMPATPVVEAEVDLDNLPF